MENLNGKSSNNFLTSNNQIPFIHSFSCSSSWSYLSSSPGFGNDYQVEALDLSSDNELVSQNSLFSARISQNQLQHQQQQLNQTQFYQDESLNVGSSQSLDSLMDSEVFVNDSNVASTNFVDMVNLNNENSLDTTTCDISQLPKTPFNETTQMWQFLLELLERKDCRSLIRWRSYDKNIHDDEFVIYDPNEIVRRWAILTRKPSMNYKKFCRILRYYYKNKILQKTAGKSHTYHFQINIQPYLAQIRWQNLQYEQQLANNPSQNQGLCSSAFNL